MNKNIVCIGGHNDGYRYDNDSLPVIELLIPIRIDAVEYKSKYTRHLHENVMVKTELYRLHQLASEDKTFSFYAENKMTATQAIEKLLDGYKPEKDEHERT